MRGVRGYTLTETVVCMVIVSLISALSLPMLSSIHSSMEVRSMLGELMTDLQFAKVAAIRENQYVVMQLAEDRYTIFLDDGAGGGIPADWLHHPDEKVLVERNIGSLGTFTSNFPDNKLRFSGIAGMRAGTIHVVGNNNQQYEIVFSRAGRIRIKKSS